MAAVLVCAGGLCGCSGQPAATVATLTLKDGSHFSGKVISKEANSITVSSSSGDVHTFLYTELADIAYGETGETPVPKADASAAKVQTAAAVSPRVPLSASASMQFPEGSLFPIRGSGFFDSCCVPLTAIALGVLDADVKGPDGKVALPRGASVTFVLRDEKTVDGQIQMQFELTSADFDSRHYLISSARSNLEPGAVVTFSGPREGSPEAGVRGTNVHLDDQTLMAFKAVTPTLFKAAP